MKRSNSLFIDSEYEKDCIDKINYFSDFTSLGNSDNLNSIVDGVFNIENKPLYADDRYRCIPCKENNDNLWKNTIGTTTKPTIRSIKITYSTTSCHNKKHENAILIYF